MVTVDDDGLDQLAEKPLALAHLTLLDEAPPALVRLAADVGYQAVGIRVHPVHPSELSWPMLRDAPMLKETKKALDDTGIEVWDIEVIRLTRQFNVDDALPILEAGGYLGASALNIFPAEISVDELADKLNALAAVAADYGIKPIIEPMIYNALPNFDAGVALLKRIENDNAGLIIDALHFHRYGGRPGDLVGREGLVASLQICDGPLVAPDAIPAPAGPLPRNQSSDAPPLALEGRAFRLLPGEGELPLAELVAALPGCPISVEAPSYPAQQDLTSREIALRSLKASRRILADAASKTSVQS